MSKLREIREGLKANIKANISDWQVSTYRLSSPTPPGIQIVRGPIRWHQAMNEGSVEYDLRVQAFVAHSTDIGPQIQLDGLLDPSGPESMVAALESDPKLGGVCDDLIVRPEMSEEGLIEGSDGMVRLVAEWVVTVHVDGSS